MLSRLTSPPPFCSTTCFAVAPVESTCMFRLPSRYTVTPLQFREYASS